MLKLFDSHCAASIIIHNALLLCGNVVHGLETLMCLPDLKKKQKNVLILGEPSAEYVEAQFILTCTTREGMCFKTKQQKQFSSQWMERLLTLTLL